MLLFPDEITHGRESHLSDKNRVTYSNIAIMHGGLVRSPPLLGTSETWRGEGCSHAPQFLVAIGGKPFPANDLIFLSPYPPDFQTFQRPCIIFYSQPFSLFIRFTNVVVCFNLLGVDIGAKTFTNRIGLFHIFCFGNYCYKPGRTYGDSEDLFPITCIRKYIWQINKPFFLSGVGWGAD